MRASIWSSAVGPEGGDGTRKDRIWYIMGGKVEDMDIWGV